MKHKLYICLKLIISIYYGMDNIILSSALAFLVTFFAIPVIIQVAKEKKFFDEPDERKVHKSVIPTLGGLGIFGGFILATLMGVPAARPHYCIFSLILFFFPQLTEADINV